MNKTQLMRAILAEAYGMGDVRIGLLTGQYPNPPLARMVLQVPQPPLRPDFRIIGDSRA